MDLKLRLQSWAQNEEMINQYYTEHGKDCLAAAEALADNDRLRAALELALPCLARYADAMPADEDTYWAVEASRLALSGTAPADPVRDAAHELLAALEIVAVNHEYNSTTDEQEYSIVTAAIAKARGHQ
jgi:hypothetical protein